jgi:carboxylate-amine ligase
LSRAGREVGLSIIAAGTHPTADWSVQLQTPKERYDNVVTELQILALRNLVCGMHVHVGLPSDDARIDVMRRITPFLPILLALSCSSPFWRGMNTGFRSYRLTSYDELPRTGLPPLFANWSHYQDYIEALRGSGIIRDASFIWWAVRPSHAHPTLELRVPDSCTSMEDTLTIAALYTCLVRALAMDSSINAKVGGTERVLAKENKWRVQRFGLRAELVDPFQGPGAVDLPTAACRLLEIVREHALALDCLGEVQRIEVIIARGTSADKQLAIYEKALAAGAEPALAFCDVNSWLQAETLSGCHS